MLVSRVLETICKQGRLHTTFKDMWNGMANRYSRTMHASDTVFSTLIAIKIQHDKLVKTYVYRADALAAHFGAREYAYLPKQVAIAIIKVLMEPSCTLAPHLLMSQ